MVPRAFQSNIDGDCYETEHPMDQRILLSAAAMVTYKTEPMSFELDSIVNVVSKDREEGSGSISVREVLKWARTDEGYATIKKDHFGAADYLKRMADDVLSNG